MVRKKRASIILLVLCMACILSCRKNSGPSWDTQILAPLIKTSLSINNLVTNTSLNVNHADSSVTLVYSDSLYSLSLDSLLKLHDTTLVNVFGGVGSFTFTVNGGNSILPLSTTADSVSTYNTGSAQLTKAILQSGEIELEVISYVPGLTDYTYTVPSATLNGKPLTLTVKVPAANGNSPGKKDTVVTSLNGYVVDFTGPQHNGYNDIVTRLRGILDPSVSSLVVNSADSIIIKATFHNVTPYYGQGYFGEAKRIIGPSKSNFPLFNNITAGNLNLKNVNVTFTLENGFGVDAQINIPQLTSINQRAGGITVPLSANIINNAININRATQTYNAAMPVTPSIQTYSITPANSNILQWIDNLPTSIGYTIDLTTDPLGNVSGNTDFAFLGQGIKAYLDVSVPLYIAANNLTLADTLPVNFASSSQAEQIKSGIFSLYASNLFPFSAGIQLYLLDNNKHITDSLCLTPQTIAAGIPNPAGFVANAQNSVLTIPINTAQASLLFSTRNIIVVARFNTGCTTCLPIQYSKIYSTYVLNIKLIGNLDYQVKG
jgi:hypothetical protein